MAALRSVRYKRHEFMHRPEKRHDSLLVFVYDVPYLAPCGIFPPFHVLNQQLLLGGSDGGMSPGATWEPFSISRQEYDELAAAVQSTDVEELRGRARYAHVRLEFDSSFDHYGDYLAWMSAVCGKHRDDWHVKLKREGFMS